MIFRGLAVTFFFSLGLFLLTSCGPNSSEISSPPIRVDSLLVDHVWPGHPVGFAMVTEPPNQFVAYYDSTRTMVVAQRKLGENTWTRQPLPEAVGWDSHNYIAMVLDSKGFLHVSGNMHVGSLVYFQSSIPFDVTSLERKEKLIGNLEDRVTYPEFFSAPEGDLIFTYRDGGSGRGNQIYNRYDPETRQWSRLHDTPLVDGQGERNAYFYGPVVGPDGFFHLIWVWRDTPDAATNHDLSYARSRDLVHWEQSDGTPQPLPITFENGEIIDPVPVKQGMINGNTVIGFDRQGRPVVTYHKFGPKGNTQIFNARREAGGWKIYQSTGWKFRWDFGGRGSLTARVNVFPVAIEEGQLMQQYYVDTAGIQKFLLDEDNLSVMGELPVRKSYPERLEAVRSTFPEMNVHLLTNTTSEGEVYVLRWETMARNRDRPREGALPAPGPLLLYCISRDRDQKISIQ